MTVRGVLVHVLGPMIMATVAAGLAATPVGAQGCAGEGCGATVPAAQPAPTAPVPDVPMPTTTGSPPTGTTLPQVSDDQGGTSSASVSVQIVPAKVLLAPGESTDVVVLIANPTDRTVLIEQLDAETTPGLVATGLDAAPFSIEPHDVQRGSMSVAAERRFEEGSVSLLAHVRSTDDADMSSLAVLTASFAVGPAASAPGLELDLVSAPSKLFDGDKAQVVVLVTNTSSFELVDVSVEGVAGRDITVGGTTCGPESETTVPSSVPDVVRFDEACADRQAVGTLLPGDAAVVPFAISSEERVHTGASGVTIVATGSYRATDDEPVGSATLTASLKVPIDLTVAGIDLLSPIGFTGLFLVPGLVSIAAFAAMLRFLYPRKKYGKLDLKDPALLLIAAAVGCVVYIGTFVAFGIDLVRDGISTSLVVVLVLVGLVIAVLAWGVYWWMHWKSIGRKQFKASDSPVIVLQRLGWRRSGLRRERYPQGLRLGDNADEKIAFSSAIHFTHPVDAPDDLKEQFRAATESGDTKELARLAKKHQVDLRFSGNGVQFVTELEDPMTGEEPLVQEQLVPLVPRE